jgi:hypothetical protein
VQIEEEKDEQLASLSSELLKLHSSLLRERKRVLFILQVNTCQSSSIVLETTQLRKTLSHPSHDINFKLWAA